MMFAKLFETSDGGQVLAFTDMEMNENTGEPFYTLTVRTDFPDRSMISQIEFLDFAECDQALKLFAEEDAAAFRENTDPGRRYFFSAN